MRGGLVTLTVALASSLTASGQIIIDNTDPGFTVLSNSWSTGTTAPGHWGDNYRFRNTTATGATFGEVEWRANLPAAGAYEVAIYYPQGTNRATDAPFTVHHAAGDTTLLINQQINGGQWVVLGTFTFAAGTVGSVSLSNAASASVVIADAVAFTPQTGTVQLSMAVSPVGWGTTTPAPGGPYPRPLNEIVAITASAYPGYEFHHWEVSAGVGPADPTQPSTTVRMDVSKTVTAVFVEQAAPEPEFRAFWADAFHAGFKSAAEIDTMIGWALAGNYNAIIAEVLAFQDRTGSGHGAYWNSALVPKATDVSPPGFDPLAYLVQRAHQYGIEVHCWLVAFRVSAAWPPAGNSIVAAHPEWLMVPQAAIGTIAKVGSYYTLDAGSPGAQDYLMSIVRELVSNYEIDGIHWDYIRYTQTDAGYPSDPNYAGSSLKRFQAITGYSGVPAPTGVPAWDDFRRRTISEFVRRALFETAVTPSARQPLRHTAALVTWYPANTDFTQTNPYKLFCDWRDWQARGYLDATVPMCYFDEASYGATYRAWVTNSVNWANASGRHTYIGPGLYLNTFADSLAQMQYSRAAGAHGHSTYSYTATNDAGTPWSNWYGYVAANFFTQPTPPPAMPWRDPATATEGYIYGRVADGLTGAPLDNVAVRLGGVSVAQTDGAGYFLVPHVATPVGGATVALSVNCPAGGGTVSRPAVRVLPAGFTEANFGCGAWLPGDIDVDGDVDGADGNRFLKCMLGPGVGPPPPGCDLFDLDADGDIDLADFSVVQLAIGQ